MTSNAPSANYTLQTQQQFQSYLAGMLGGNLIDVELTTQDYNNAYNTAKTVWFQKGNVNLNESFIAVPAVQGQTVYDLSGYSTPAIDTIIKIAKPTGSFYTTSPFGLSIFEDLMLGFINQTAVDIFTFEGTLEFLDLINLYTVAYPDYNWNRRKQILTLTKPAYITELWFLHCYTYPADVDLYNLLWIQEYSLAVCKDILGHAYQKYSAIQGPAGDISLPGAALIQEAQQMKTELISNIANYTDADEVSGYILLG